MICVRLYAGVEVCGLISVDHMGHSTTLSGCMDGCRATLGSFPRPHCSPQHVLLVCVALRAIPYISSEGYCKHFIHIDPTI